MGIFFAYDIITAKSIVFVHKIATDHTRRDIETAREKGECRGKVFAMTLFVVFEEVDDRFKVRRAFEGQRVAIFGLEFVDERFDLGEGSFLCLRPCSSHHAQAFVQSPKHPHICTNGRCERWIALFGELKAQAFGHFFLEWSQESHLVHTDMAVWNGEVIDLKRSKVTIAFSSDAFDGERRCLGRCGESVDFGMAGARCTPMFVEIAIVDDTTQAKGVRKASMYAQDSAFGLQHTRKRSHAKIHAKARLCAVEERITDALCNPLMDGGDGERKARCHECCCKEGDTEEDLSSGGGALKGGAGRVECCESKKRYDAKGRH